MRWRRRTDLADAAVDDLAGEGVQQPRLGEPLERARTLGNLLAAPHEVGARYSWRAKPIGNRVLAEEVVFEWHDFGRLVLSVLVEGVCRAHSGRQMTRLGATTSVKRGVPTGRQLPVVLDPAGASRPAVGGRRYPQRMSLIDRVEERRKVALAGMDPSQQAALGQYFTPDRAALIIAGMPRVPHASTIRVLDPGAGNGMLTAALVDRLVAERPDVKIQVTAIEIDAALRPTLRQTLDDLEALGSVTTELLEQDFLAWGLSTNDRFDLVIQNPPYAKLQTGSPRQNLLRAAGIDVPNIYAAFLALGVRLLVDGGQQVAITPRSWMNGTYYSRFRHEFVRSAGIDAIHTFESRSKVFGDTGVLQEAIVVSATRNRHPAEVTVFTSHDHTDQASQRSVAYGDVVTADFIHVPATEEDAAAVAWMTQHATHSLAELGLTVSTGRVVDFRSRDMLFQERVNGAWPMVHANHLRNGETRHPIGAKKPEWFHAAPAIASKLLVPAGAYVLIKRFSAKEERRRVVAGVWTSNAETAFDNKLNYVHASGQGLDPDVARGLAVFLNSSRLDAYFRVFSGHTQVNATDLRQMRFPSIAQLHALAAVDAVSQNAIDDAVEAVLAGVRVAA